MIQPVLGEPSTGRGAGDIREHPGEIPCAHMSFLRHQRHRYWLIKVLQSPVDHLADRSGHRFQR